MASPRTPRTISLSLPLLLLGLASSAASPVRFDQRQNGSVNVQVDLKDLEVFAIMEGEQLEGAMAQAVESVRPSQDRQEAQESLKGPLLSPGSFVDSAAPAPAAAAPPAPPAANANGNSAVPSSNAPRRPNDKLAAIKHKTGGLLPHERSDAAPLELPPWETAAARGEEVADDVQEEEDLEPRSTTVVEARAAPAPPASASAAAAAPPRPTQSQGVRPAGTVSVAHLHCGLGYYRDQTGRCRRARRPSSSNTRKHHHGTRRQRPAPAQQGAKLAAAASPAAPAPVSVAEPVKDLPLKNSAVKSSITKETAVKSSAPKEPTATDSKDSVKEATPISGTTVKEPVSDAASPVPASVPLPVAPKPAIKEAAKETIKEAVKEVAKQEPVSLHKPQPAKQAPAKATAVKVPVQDRISSSGHKAGSAVSGNVNVKEAVKLQPVQLKSPPKPPVREAAAAKPLRQPSKPVAVAVKDKEAPKVSHHHSQHKITVIKEDTKPRSPIAPVKVAVKPASPNPGAVVPAAIAAAVKKN